MRFVVRVFFILTLENKLGYPCNKLLSFKTPMIVKFQRLCDSCYFFQSVVFTIDILCNKMIKKKNRYSVILL